MTIGQFVVLVILLIQSFFSIELLSIRAKLKALEKSYELHNVMMETTWKDVPILGAGENE